MLINYANSFQKNKKHDFVSSEKLKTTFEPTKPFDTFKSSKMDTITFNGSAKTPDEKAIALLLKGRVSDFNTFRSNNLEFIPCLSNVNLNRANLHQANLSRADLRDAKLVRASLIKANLDDAELSRANLTEAKLYRASLIESNLCEAILYKANLLGANLIMANLNGANLNQANLNGVMANLADLKMTTQETQNYIDNNYKLFNLNPRGDVIIVPKMANIVTV